MISLIKQIKLINHNVKVLVLEEDLFPLYKDVCLKEGADYYFSNIKDNKLNANDLLRIVRNLKVKKINTSDKLIAADTLFRNNNIFENKFIL